MHVKNGDKVVVISGKGVNMITKHNKPAGPTKPGGIVKYEGPINASKVMLYCDKDKSGVRVGYDILNGNKVRVCKKCGEVLDK